MSLFRFFKNPFTRKPMIRLVAYTTAQLASVTADNPGGIHTTRITALNTAFSGLDDSMEDVETKAAIRAGRVQAKRIFRGTTMPPELAAIHAAVVLAYGEGSPDMVECFPQGRGIFKDCLEGELDDHLGQLHTCIAARTATLGAPIVTRAAALVSTWDTLAGDAGEAGGDVEMMRAARAAAKTALTDQLFLMLLHLAATYPGNTMKFNEYVPEHLLEPPNTTPAPDAPTLVSGYVGGLSVPLTATCDDNTELVNFARRMVGEVDFTPIADDVSVDGSFVGVFTDTLPGPGHYEYQAVASGPGGTSEPSNVVLVAAD
jgi:hypothetical protein